MLVQHFEFIGVRSSHRRKSAACPKLVMVWLYRSPILVWRRGVISSFKWFLPAFALRRRGGGERVSTLCLLHWPCRYFFTIWTGGGGTTNLMRTWKNFKSKLCRQRVWCRGRYMESWKLASHSRLQVLLFSSQKIYYLCPVPSSCFCTPRHLKRLKKFFFTLLSCIILFWSLKVLVSYGFFAN